MFNQNGYLQNQNGYLQNPYGFTPFVTKDTNTEAVRVFQGDEMVQQLSQLNNSMGAYMQQTEKRFRMQSVKNVGNVHRSI